MSSDLHTETWNQTGWYHLNDTDSPLWHCSAVDNERPEKQQLISQGQVPAYTCMIPTTRGHVKLETDGDGYGSKWSKSMICKYK